MATFHGTNARISFNGIELTAGPWSVDIKTPTERIEYDAGLMPFGSITLEYLSPYAHSPLTPNKSGKFA